MEVQKTSLPKFAESEVEWYLCSDSLTYDGQRPSLDITIDTLRFFQKYFPKSHVAAYYSSPKLLIGHDEYGLGEIDLHTLGIDKVLTLLYSGLVRKLLIHKNKSRKLSRTLRLVPDSFHVEKANGYLNMYIDAGDLELPEDYKTKDIENLPDKPIHVELSVSPSSKSNKSFADKIFDELKAII